MKAVLTLIVIALALNVQAGRYFVTGHDADFHAAEGSSAGVNIIWKSIRYVTGGKALVANSSPRILLVTGNVDPGGGAGQTADPRLGLLAAGYEPLPSGRTGPNNLPSRDPNVPLRGYFEVAYSDDETPSNYKLDSVIDSGLSAFDAIVVASDMGGWLRQSELDVLNAHDLDLQAYVNDNANKGIIAFAQSGSRVGGISRGTTSARFAFLPGVESEVLAQHEGGVVPLNCNPVGLTQDDVSVNVSHCVFTCVPGWGILDIDNAGNILSIIRDTSSQAAGMVDTDFSENANNLNLNGTVSVIAIEPRTGKIIIGGAFTTPRKHILRVFRDGTLDDTFNPPDITSSSSIYTPIVNAIVFQPDGKILVGGFLPIVAGTDGRNLIRLNENGALDCFPGTSQPTLRFTGLNDPTHYIKSIAFQNDGRIIIGGYWTPSAIFPSENVARLLATKLSPPQTPAGGLDATWATTPNGFVHTVIIDPFFDSILDSTTIMIAGNFTSVADASGSHPAQRVARLSDAGNVDTRFNPVSRNAYANTLILPRGFHQHYLVGGAFTTAPARMVRLTDIGTTDPNFVTPTAFSSGMVREIREQCDGKLLVNGTFPGKLVRLRSDGILDETFTAPMINNVVFTTAIQEDGKILIGGSFTSLEQPPGSPAIPAFRLARLHGVCN